MRRQAGPWFAVALLLTAASASASAEKVSDLDRFQLWNECKPLFLLVRNLDEGAKEIGLTKQQLEIAARSRLRAARIYSAEVQSGPQVFYYVNVDIGKGGTFLVLVELWKWVEDELRGITGFWRATTWKTYGYGTHGQDPTTLVSLVSQLTDKFIDEYLRVNEDSCK